MTLVLLVLLVANVALAVFYVAKHTYAWEVCAALSGFTALVVSFALGGRVI